MRDEINLPKPLRPLERLLVVAIRNAVDSHQPECGPGGDSNPERKMMEILEQADIKLPRRNRSRILAKFGAKINPLYVWNWPKSKLDAWELEQKKKRKKTQH